jgi:hypothetical protein
MNGTARHRGEEECKNEKHWRSLAGGLHVRNSGVVSESEIADL